MELDSTKTTPSDSPQAHSSIKSEVLINVSEEKRRSALPKHNGDEIDVDSMKEIAQICADKIAYSHKLPVTEGTRVEIIAWSSFTPDCCICDIIAVRLSDDSWSDNVNFVVDLFPTIGVSGIYLDRHIEKFIQYHSR